jgi:hypothetical protein
MAKPTHEAKNRAVVKDFRRRIPVKRVTRFAAYVLFLSPVLCTLPRSFAQSLFDGTWRINLDQSNLSSKPMVISLNNGVYDCESCMPKLHVRADGQDQAVTGHVYDAISVREIDSKTIAVTEKHGGKTISEDIATISGDGTTLTWRSADYLKNSDQQVSEEATFTRVGKAPAGAHAASGAWRINKARASENALTATFKMNGDELSFSQNSGQSLTAKFDGKDYPFHVRLPPRLRQTVKTQFAVR